MKRSFTLITSRKQALLLLFLALPVVWALTGCSGGTGAGSGSTLTMAPLSAMPAEVQNAAVSVQEAYRFAVANPDALKNVPCYCGCDAAGHTSNYSCYINEAKSSPEQPVFDSHALGCTICVDITRDVMKMTSEGVPQADIFTSIDSVYSQYGPSNMPAD